MPFLVILKRFEVWLLVSVVAALLLFAFRPEKIAPGEDSAPVGKSPSSPSILPAPSGSPAGATSDPEKVESLTVREVKVSGSEEGRIVELTLYGRSLSGHDIVLDESTISAMTNEGEPVARFFEPFREPALLLASEDSLATLRWWLARPADVIWLDLQGRRVKAELP